VGVELAIFSRESERSQSRLDFPLERGKSAGGLLYPHPDHSRLAGSRKTPHPADADLKRCVRRGGGPDRLGQGADPPRLDLAEKLEREVDPLGRHPADDAPGRQAREAVGLLPEPSPKRIGEIHRKERA
jgi:hypothetical protein